MADPLSPKSPRKGKIINVRVHFLDDSVHAFQIPTKASGSVLWDQIIRHLQLMESDYFDVEYADEHGVLGWVDRDKPVIKQLPSPDTPMRFRVKFYMPDPSLLEEEFTRYLFSLQIKHDLSLGLMTCSENTAALLASYIAQAEIGDFSLEDFIDHTYLSNLKFVPNQTESLEIKIMEYHRNHLGLSPSDADLNLLDTARKVELYGILMYQARDHESVHLTLAVAHMGVLVFQNHTKINTFSWAKIRKLSFKRKKFLIKLHPESHGYYRDTVEFFFESRNECKGFWKRCIEHHAFFRCLAVKKLARNKTRVVSRGSSFRYSGRTQKQLMEFVRENYTKHPGFERSVSGRISCRSTSVTPKINPKSSTLNSSDLRSHNSTASSGSHLLDTSQDNHLCSTRVETAEVHSDSSMSGSRSLGSPKLETARSHDGLGRDGTELDGSGDDLDGPDQERVPDLSPIKQVKSSPGPIFMKDRKMSAPVLGYKDSQNCFDDLHLSRSPEIENIPETVEDMETSPTRTSLLRTFNATPPVQNHKAAVTPPPTPPPPLVEDSGISILSNQNKSSRSFDQSTVASSSVGIPSNISVLSSRTDDSEEDPKRKSKKYPVDRSYYIAKELLMTERTYKKDLEVLTVWFRNAVSKEDVMPEYLTHLLFSNLDPIYESHCNFLKEIEQRVLSWEGKPSAQVNGADPHHIGDILLGTMPVLQFYCHFLDRQEDILSELEQGCKRSRKFEQVYRDFEAQKVCYLPLNTFLLKPGQRLLHYKLILERLTKHYSREHPDFKDAMAALAKVIAVIKDFKEKMKKLETLQKLMELQRDLVGIDNLVHPERDFIREGCLQKLSRKGYQQRMFFLFSDMMVYTSRTATSLLQFKVHGQLPLRGMMVEESDHAKMAVPNSFAIYGGNKCILVAASSEEEKDKWKEDMMDAIQRAKARQDDKLKYASLKSSASSSENVDGNDEGEPGLASPSTPDKHIQHRANTTMHVCWHRNTSVSMRDHDKARKNQLSGYLLRKFKNGTGWQKLWVVFTNFCLFFYKTYQDDFPLASLPLLGYAVTTPADEDAIHKDHVFKLQFKNHVYFFRAESEYTFSRWLEVINSATRSARRIRLFSRLESESVTAKN